MQSLIVCLISTTIGGGPGRHPVRRFWTNLLDGRNHLGIERPSANAACEPARAIFFGREQEGAVWRMALAGDRLVSVGPAAAIRRWTIDPHVWRAAACAIANRQLTCDEWKQYCK